jgi:hypothetical protein
VHLVRADIVHVAQQNRAVVIQQTIQLFKVLGFASARVPLIMKRCIFFKSSSYNNLLIKLRINLPSTSFSVFKSFHFRLVFSICDKYSAAVLEGFFRLLR